MLGRFPPEIEAVFNDPPSPLPATRAIAEVTLILPTGRDHSSSFFSRQYVKRRRHRHNANSDAAPSRDSVPEERKFTLIK